MCIKINNLMFSFYNITVDVDVIFSRCIFSVTIVPYIVLASAVGVSGLVWLVPLVILTAKFGRRKTFLIISLKSLLGFTILYFSTTTSQILVGLLMHGAARSAVYILSPIIVVEYSSPRHRGLFSTLESACFFWGIWIANAIGTFVHWKNIAILGVLCSLYTLIAIFWPESPQWLANKGKFNECVSAHRWLRGSSSRSEKELAYLISSQTREHEELVKFKMLKREPVLNRICEVVKETSFYKPFLICVLMSLHFVFSGKYVTSVYSLEMIKKITNSNDAAYTGMLILDGITVFCTYIGCILAKFIKRRTLFFTASSISILFMLMISLHLYLIMFNVISESSIISLLLLSGFSIGASCGPMILLSTIKSELMPLKYRSVMYLLVSFLGQLSLTILLKTSLLIFRVLGMHGTFLFYVFFSTFFLSLLYKYLPETKDKTLQEIEEHFKEN